MSELKNNRLCWSRYFLEMLNSIAMRSLDPRTKVGAVIVGPDHEIRSQGYNGFPRGVKDTEDRWKQENKLTYVIHAEMNAILNSSRCGISLKDCIIYTPWEPCLECIKAIINVGINKIVVDKFGQDAYIDKLKKEGRSNTWYDGWVIGKQLLEEAKVYKYYCDCTMEECGRLRTFDRVNNCYRDNCPACECIK